MPSGRGSSSSSSVLAEAIRAGTAPAAIVLGEADPILALGAIVARELYGTTIPVVVTAESALRPTTSPPFEPTRPASSCGAGGEAIRRLAAARSERTRLQVVDDHRRVSQHLDLPAEQLEQSPRSGCRTRPSSTG